VKQGGEQLSQLLKVPVDTTSWVSEEPLDDASMSRLRDLGITHAPCIIQQVYSREELNVVASTAVNAQPDLFVRHPRPPMLKDYFDPKLRKIIPVIRRLRQVTLKFQVDEAFVPAF